MAVQQLAVKPPETIFSRHITDAERIQAARCERIAMWWLKALGIEDIDYTESWHYYPEWIDCKAEPFQGKYNIKDDHTGNKFDFYSPSLNLWFEVTSCPVSFSRSAQIFGNASLLVLHDKISIALYEGLLNRLWFVSVNLKEGDIRFIYGPNVIQYGLPKKVDVMPEWEGEYYAIPWHQWFNASELCSELGIGQKPKKEGP